MNRYPPGSDPYGTPGMPSPEQPRQVRVTLPHIRPIATYALIGVTVVVFALQS